MGDWSQPLQQISASIVKRAMSFVPQENTYYIACLMIRELQIENENLKKELEKNATKVQQEKRR